MKLLLDPVYTNRPSVCSTSYLFWQLIAELSEWREDIFFYLLHPDTDLEEDKKFLGQYPDRVVLLPTWSDTSDRVSELFILDRAVKNYLHPMNPKTWDFDMVVSSRIPMLSSMYPHMTRHMGKKMPSLRAVVGLDEMPFLPIRDTVPWSTFMAPHQLENYCSSDGVLVNNLWTSRHLRKVGREVLSVAHQKKLMDSVQECVPVKCQRLNLKTEGYKEGDFNLTFVGRITATRNFQDTAEVFRKKFSYSVGKKRDLKFLVSTNSISSGSSDYGEIDFIDFQYNNREQFYQFLKDAHLALNLSTVEDFSLTTYETLLYGVPIIVKNEPWNSFLGEDYPFRAENMLEVHGMINAFAERYSLMYSRFKAWEETTWKSFVEGERNTTTADRLKGLISAYESRRNSYVVETGIGGSFKDELLQLIANSTGASLDLTKHQRERGRFIEGGGQIRNVLSRSPNNLMMKVLAGLEGYRDTKEPGVMVKI